jgi:hypothetical protein
LKKREAIKIIRTDHQENHDGHNVSEGRLSLLYMIPNLREKVNSVGGHNCKTCAKHEPIKKKSIQPITTERKGELVMFDLAQFYVPVQTHNTLVRASCKE